MELFLNLTWLAVSAAVIGHWLRHNRCWADEPSHLSFAVQLAGMALLIAILLPAISLNDDLRTAIGPAETEHVLIRKDFQAIAEAPPRFHWTASPFLAPVLTGQEPPMPVWLAVPPDERSILLPRFSHFLVTRAPPAA